MASNIKSFTLGFALSEVSMFTKILEEKGIKYTESKVIVPPTDDSNTFTLQIWLDIEGDLTLMQELAGLFHNALKEQDEWNSIL